MSQLPKAVALLSGGLDSGVATWLARRTHEVVLALTADYGQRAARSEIRQAAQLARSMNVPHRILNLPWFAEFRRGGALLERGDLPSPSNLDDTEETLESAAAVWVPNRNGVLIEIAAGFAEDLDAKTVIVGFNREEAATFPDNTPAYLQALTGALGFSTSNGVEVLSPTVDWDKTEMVRAAREAGFPFSEIWSCYRDGERMCGRCESCKRLKRALVRNEIQEVRFEDPSIG